MVKAGVAREVMELIFVFFLWFLRLLMFIKLMSFVIGFSSCLHQKFFATCQQKLQDLECCECKHFCF